MGDFDLIIFDCDGTLVDTEVINNQATVDVLADLGIRDYDLNYVQEHWSGKTLSSILLTVQMEKGIQLPANMGPLYISKVQELKKSGYQSVSGADELVEKAGKHFKICVASNGERTLVLESLHTCGLMKQFTEDTVFTKSQVKNGKPAPDLFLFAAQKMGADPERCLVIEDSHTGVRAGVAANMTAWGFTGSSHDPASHAQTLKSAGAHLVFERLIHIREKLGL